MKKHVSITVYGKLKNTGFRFGAIEKALENELTGEIKRYEEDKVQIEVEGEVDNIQPFLKWCHVGPKDTVIDKVDFVSSEDLQKYETFSAEVTW